MTKTGNASSTCSNELRDADLTEVTGGWFPSFFSAPTTGARSGSLLEIKFGDIKGESFDD